MKVTILSAVAVSVSLLFSLSSEADKVRVKGPRPNTEVTSPFGLCTDGHQSSGKQVRICYFDEEQPDFVMLSDGGIVLEANRKLGLTVRGQNISNESPIILHEGYNRWQWLSDSSLVLINNKTGGTRFGEDQYGLTVYWQKFEQKNRVILHRGYNQWEFVDTHGTGPRWTRAKTKRAVPIPGMKDEYLVLMRDTEARDYAATLEIYKGGMLDTEVLVPPYEVGSAFDPDFGESKARGLYSGFEVARESKAKLILAAFKDAYIDGAFPIDHSQPISPFYFEVQTKTGTKMGSQEYGCLFIRRDSPLDPPDATPWRMYGHPDDNGQIFDYKKGRFDAGAVGTQPRCKVLLWKKVEN